ncbi:MAG: DUF2306 domain-containing protein [Planctomycetales bacterium]
MSAQRSPTAILLRALPWLAALLIVRVTLAVVWQYRDYFPPNFEAFFLQGRESYFFGIYQYAFYPHLVAGPCTLLAGLALLSDRLRVRYPAGHRRLGRVQALLVLFGVAPSGLIMAWRAQAGPVAALGFAFLALVTALCVAMGWRLAVARQFAAHRRWMWRCYLLLCSTVLLRLMAGLHSILDVDAPWIDQVVPWGSWLLPLAAYELYSARPRWAKGGVRNYREAV